MKRANFVYFGFLVPLILFVTHQLLQIGLSINILFLDAYLDPFCASAMACYLISAERRFLFGERNLTWIDAVVIVIFLSIVTEWIFPIFSDKFVSDWIDVLSILAGVLWFMVTKRKD